MAFDPISAGIDLVKTFANKFLSDKMTEAEKATIAMQAEAFVVTESRNEDSAFRQFVIDYEGDAEKAPRPILWLRSMIRPCFTILVGYLDWLYFTGNISAWTPEAVGLLKGINIIVLLFWFGERAVKNSGLIELLLKKKE